jgi:hypothetical protein
MSSPPPKKKTSMKSYLLRISHQKIICKVTAEKKDIGFSCYQVSCVILSKNYQTGKINF